MSFNATGDNNGINYDDDEEEENYDYQQPPVNKKARKTVVFDETRNSKYSHTAVGNDTRSPVNVQQILTGLRKAYETNSIQRAKVGDTAVDPLNPTSVDTTAAAALSYMDSEVHLYEHIVQLKTPTMSLMDGISTILEKKQQDVLTDVVIPLLIHDNVDISIAMISVLLNWLEEFRLVIESFDDDDDDDEDDDKSNNQRRRKVLSLQQQLVRSLFQDGIMDLLIDNLGRMESSCSSRKSSNRNIQNNNNDSDDDVGRGIDDVLSIIEYVLEIDLETTMINGDFSTTSSGSNSNTSTLNVACRLFTDNSNLISWLFTQQQEEDDNDTNDSGTYPYRNRSMELLASILNNEEIYTTTCISDLIWTKIAPYISSFWNSDTNSNNDRNNNNNDNKNDECIDAIEIILQNIGQYRKRQPTTDDEVEFLENNTIVMTSLLLYGNSNSSFSNPNENVISAFVDAQGIELVMRCLKERVYTGAITLPWLDMNHPYHPKACRAACEHMIHVGLLKYLFPLFMGKHLPKLYNSESTTTTTTSNSYNTKQKKRRNQFYNKIETTTIRIIYTLIQTVQDDSPNDVKARLLAKFFSSKEATNDSDIDNNNNNIIVATNEKIVRLIDLIIKYDQQVRLAEYKFYQSDIEDVIQKDIGTVNNDDDDDDDDDPQHTTNNSSIVQLAVLETKLAAGGDILYRLVAIVAFCCAHSLQLQRQILYQLSHKQLSINFIKDTLQDFIALLDNKSHQKVLLQTYLEKI